ncbi:dimeric dUTPase (all-alpha-NTP-PPase superfamily) [Bacillus thermophilus]|uniref:Dimeric dUTPase (All-alpha-NTP-PPase superfamily) n=1 Tax=Siminovitchia thermophila TaxID=1245522 RepID=A0ABS2RD94_9BACI|nr:dUTP diphosphatase [Siminovitchia thermophila]MBM7717169.1 dimeric dUTPase (all-alpha-NTP-PPase superfamily) [Siminovitchia thermophila]
MNFPKLFEMQSFLDQNIRLTQGIPVDKDLTEDKKDALDVEISELQNEIKYFKFWKRPETRKVNREAALEEYVDGLHFFLSLGNDYQVPLECGYREILVKDDLQGQFRIIKHYISIMNGPMHWHIAFGLYLGLAEMLGFSDEEIERKYLEKNTINHQRQAEGY